MLVWTSLVYIVPSVYGLYAHQVRDYHRRGDLQSLEISRLCRISRCRASSRGENCFFSLKFPAYGCDTTDTQAGVVEEG